MTTKLIAAEARTKELSLLLARMHLELAKTFLKLKEKDGADEHFELSASIDPSPSNLNAIAQAKNSWLLATCKYIVF